MGSVGPGPLCSMCGNIKDELINYMYARIAAAAAACLWVPVVMLS